MLMLGSETGWLYVSGSLVSIGTSGLIAGSRVVGSGYSCPHKIPPIMA